MHEKKEEEKLSEVITFHIRKVCVFVQDVFRIIFVAALLHSYQCAAYYLYVCNDWCHFQTVCVNLFFFITKRWKLKVTIRVCTVLGAYVFILRMLVIFKTEKKTLNPTDVTPYILKTWNFKVILRKRTFSIYQLPFELEWIHSSVKLSDLKYF